MRSFFGQHAGVKGPAVARVPREQRPAKPGGERKLIRVGGRAPASLAGGEAVKPGIAKRLDEGPCFARFTVV